MQFTWINYPRLLGVGLYTCFVDGIIIYVGTSGALALDQVYRLFHRREKLQIFFRGGGQVSRSIRFLRLTGDIIALHLAFVLAFLLRFGGHLPSYNFSSYIKLAPWLTMVFIGLGTVYDLYGRERGAAPERRLSLMMVVAFTAASAAGLSFFIGVFSLPRTVLLLALPLQFVLALGWHQLVDYIAKTFGPEQRILVLGDAASLDRIQAELFMSGLGNERSVTSGNPQTPVELLALMEQLHPTAIVLGDNLAVDIKKCAVEQGLHIGARVYLVPDVYELFLHSSRSSALGTLPVLVMDWAVEDPLRRTVKRGFDLAVACIGMVVALPIMGIVTLGVWIADGRPILYKQIRAGGGGRPFTMLKFRSMRVDAEAQTGPVLSDGEHDPRVTRLGRFLRRTRLDELPQLWNILIGDMSFVGPRPERPFFVDQFSSSLPGYTYRLRMKPGLTGLAQVEGRYSTPAEDKIRFDLLYFHSYNLWSDVTILLKTAKTVLLRSKAS